MKNIYSGESGLDDDAYVLKQMKKQPGDLASNIRHFLENPKQYQQDDPVTPAQALAMLLDIGWYQFGCGILRMVGPKK